MMWPLSIWRNFVKNKERKKWLLEKLAWLEVEEMKCSIEWNEMLIGHHHNTVLSSKTEHGLAKEYKAFMNSNSGDGRLGSINSIKVSGQSIVDGTHFLFLSYHQIDLATGVSLMKYNDVIQKSDGISKQIESVQQEIGEKRRFWK